MPPETPRPPKRPDRSNPALHKKDGPSAHVRYGFEYLAFQRDRIRAQNGGTLRRIASNILIPSQRGHVRMERRGPNGEYIPVHTSQQVQARRERMARRLNTVADTMDILKKRSEGSKLVEIYKMIRAKKELRRSQARREARLRPDVAYTGHTGGKTRLRRASDEWVDPGETVPPRTPFAVLAEQRTDAAGTQSIPGPDDYEQKKKDLWDDIMRRWQAQQGQHLDPDSDAGNPPDTSPQTAPVDPQRSYSENGGQVNGDAAQRTSPEPPQPPAVPEAVSSPAPPDQTAVPATQTTAQQTEVGGNSEVDTIIKDAVSDLAAEIVDDYLARQGNGQHQTQEAPPADTPAIEAPSRSDGLPVVVDGTVIEEGDEPAQETNNDLLQPDDVFFGGSAEADGPRIVINFSGKDEVAPPEIHEVSSLDER